MPSAAIPPARPVMTIDDGWYRAVNSFAQRTGWLHRPMEVYTLVGIAALAVLAVLAWWSARAHADRRAMAAVAWLGLGTVLSILAGLALKQVFQEARPCRTIALTTVQACPGATDYSFPSDHMTVAVALAIGLWLVNHKLGLVAVALAAVEGFSRVYLGQHYPHDVLGAVVLSSVIMLGGWLLARGPLIRLIAALERTPLRVILTVSPT